MHTCKKILQSRGVWWAGAAITALLAILWIATPSVTRAENERVITIYYDGDYQTIVTSASTIEEAIERAQITLSEHDAVEPALDTTLVAPGYNVNIYRARPVTVLDGAQRYQIMSPHTSARQMAESAGLKVHPEDEFSLTRIDDFLAGGVGLQLEVHRSTPLTLVLYGNVTQARTQAKTVEELLKEKDITLAQQDGVSPNAATPITPGMTVAVYRDGVQTVTEEQEVEFGIEHIQDADRDIGYREVVTPGVKGLKVVTYHVETRNGQEIGRQEIQSVVTVQPQKQVEVVGVKSAGDRLTKAKGVFHFRDSNGVVHRETYYDLPMNGVMGFCGGGTYSVRLDGAKVDEDGYILVAANLNRYPRCSIVETSLGLGRVYDTGGFAAVHPDGFDLATDWTNNDGR